MSSQQALLQVNISGLIDRVALHSLTFVRLVQASGVFANHSCGSRQVRPMHL